MGCSYPPKVWCVFTKRRPTLPSNGVAPRVAPYFARAKTAKFFSTSLKVLAGSIGGVPFGKPTAARTTSVSFRRKVGLGDHQLRMLIWLAGTNRLLVKIPPSPGMLEAGLAKKPCGTPVGLGLAW